MNFKNEEDFLKSVLITSFSHFGSHFLLQLDRYHQPLSECWRVRRHLLNRSDFMINNTIDLDTTSVLILIVLKVSYICHELDEVLDELFFCHFIMHINVLPG